MTARLHPVGRAGKAPRGPAGTRPSSRRRVPSSAEELVRGFVRLFLEVEAGVRPRRHLFPLMCPLLVARMTGSWTRPGPAGTLVTLHGSRPSPKAFEAVAVVRRGRRYGAIGIRLARHERGWRVEDLVRPELGPLPPAPYLVVLDGDGTDEAPEQSLVPRQENGRPRRSPRSAHT